MSKQPDLARARRESIRWTILLTLNTARPIGAAEAMVCTIIDECFQPCDLQELRREIDYLIERELVKREVKPYTGYHYTLTRHGIDVAEYTVDCGPGIARPKQYW